MLNFTNVSRWKAAGVHFVISVIIAIAACILILLIWYPGPLFSAIGGMVLLGLIVGVDVCLGPLMTLIVFNNTKSRREIILDLSMISLVQIAALGYGLYTTFVARPAFIVYHQQAFHVMVANDMEPAWFKNVQHPKFKHSPLFGPEWAAVRQPTDDDVRGSSDFSFYEALRNISGSGAESQPAFYTDLSSVNKELMEKSESLDRLRKHKPESANQLDRAISGKNAAEVGYFPLKTKRQNLVVLINKRDGSVIDVLAIDPY